MKSIWFLLALTVASVTRSSKCHNSVVPVISIDPKQRILKPVNRTTGLQLQYLPFIALVEKHKDTSEYWRATELLTLIRSNEAGVDYTRCAASPPGGPVRLASARTVHPICRDSIDFQLCPQCAHFNNKSECELFRDSCKEKRVPKAEYNDYCDRKYGKWRTVFIPSDYSQCRCCDECIFYRGDWQIDGSKRPM